ncbi:MAG: hypothetical protein KDD29_01375 [Flavobacteriales bacterium]|nr:hypothetical protein [Flavobacteriales bacterium]MCB9335990.1 hypothetical protein [Flavobacteriales bacterium]
MKIKIPSQLNKKIEGLSIQQDVIENSTKGESAKISSNLIGVTEHQDGEQRVNQFLAVENDSIKYISAFPSPTHLYLSTAIELYQVSEHRKNINFLKCGTKTHDDKIVLLEFENGYTHECFTDYFKAKTTSIIMLVSSLEIFMNQHIHQNYTYTWKDEKWNHEKIENKLSFNIKLEHVIPDACDLKNLWKENFEDLNIIKNLYNQRKEFVHLKTKSKEDWKRYTDSFDSLTKFDLKEAIEASITFMNTVSPGFIEIENNL